MYFCANVANAAKVEGISASVKPSCLQEIVSELAKRTHFTEEYLQRIGERGVLPLLPITVGRTLYLQPPAVLEQNVSIFTEQSNIIREMAEKSNCVIVGRCANYVLREHQPFRIFVYADMSFKMARCREKRKGQTDLTDKELKRKIISVDKSRAKYHELFTDQIWGEKLNYDLCINTSMVDIKEVASAIAGSIKRA